MSQRLESVPPEPWEDPEFAGGGRHTFRGKSPTRRSPRRIGALGLIVAVSWLVLLFDPMIRPLVLGGLLALGLTLGVLLAAMALGMVGTSLFAVGDRVIAWVRQGSR